MRCSFEDKIGLAGMLQVVIRRRGRIIEVWRDRNLVVDVPRVQIARLLAGESGAGAVLPVTHIAVGTNGTAPAAGDTSITNAFSKPLLSVTRPTATTVLCKFTILETEAVGLAIREFGLLRSDGSLFARRTRSGAIEKAADLELQGEWTLMI